MSIHCVVFVANRGYALTSSRTGLIRHFLSKGWRVVVATADDTESRLLQDMGVQLEAVSFNRGGFSLLADFAVYRRLFAIYHKWRPLLIHHFHAKPVMYGTIAARRALGKRVKVVNTITGLGHAFITGGLSGTLAGLGYRVALPKCDITIFQNRDDRVLFLDHGWVAENNTKFIPGSGVDLERFSEADRKFSDTHAPTVIMLGRLLRQKGVQEFVDVAREIHSSHPDVRFLWAGELDLIHPDAVSEKWIEDQDEIKYLGRLDDVFELLNEADLLLFPSYREGVPRAVLEASATGLPTVGFDVPGVREVVCDGETGFLLPFGDVSALIKCVEKLLDDSELRIKMGMNARKMVEEKFDIRIIQSEYLQVYSELGMDVS